MEKSLKYCFYILIVSIAFQSCSKDYLVGGQKEDVNMYKDLTTLQVLEGMPMYDTLVEIIKVAGLENKINENGQTFFAPDNSAIFRYLNDRTVYVQNHYNQNAIFGLDSLKYYISNNIDGTKD